MNIPKQIEIDLRLQTKEDIHPSFLRELRRREFSYCIIIYSVVSLSSILTITSSFSPVLLYISNGLGITILQCFAQIITGLIVIILIQPNSANIIIVCRLQHHQRTSLPKTRKRKNIQFVPKAIVLILDQSDPCNFHKYLHTDEGFLEQREFWLVH